MKNMMKKGFSLIEILLVVGFIAAAVAVVFIAYPKLQSSARANTEVQNTATISGGVKTLYASQSSYVGLSTAQLISARVVPDNMVNGTTLNNQFGGAVTITPTSIGAAAGLNNAFTVEYSNVPSEDCVKFASQAAPNFTRVHVIPNATATPAAGALTTTAAIVKNSNPDTAGAVVTYSVAGTVAACAAQDRVKLWFVSL